MEAVLEVSTPNISGGDFLDMTDRQVGGGLSAGGYTGEICRVTRNPLAGRMAWSGNSGGYIDTVVNLGPNLADKRLRYVSGWVPTRRAGAGVAHRWPAH